MSSQISCTCRCCTTRRLLWPAVVITIGVLFLLQEMRGGYFDFSNTWPVILVVIGAVLLASALGSREGHLSAGAPPSATPGTPGAPPSATPGPFPGQGQ